ncbi:hypothetical protein C8J57DRAFT_1720068 [Mycena rebaudengoi]|nr:hypothetical protein C8J57DRAFT_1720068 [Mycena rebaudengoi]
MYRAPYRAPCRAIPRANFIDRTTHRTAPRPNATAGARHLPTSCASPIHRAPPLPHHPGKHRIHARLHPLTPGPRSRSHAHDAARTPCPAAHAHPRHVPPHHATAPSTQCYGPAPAPPIRCDPPPSTSTVQPLRPCHPP